MTANRHLMTDKEFENTYKFAKRENVRMIVGASSIYVQSWQTKFLRKSHCKEVNGIWYLPGEYARYVIDDEWGKNRELPRNWQLKMKLSAPRMFLGQYQGDAVYIDLKSAFYQIYKRLWGDMSYPRGRGLLPLNAIAERLHFWKAARNSVVGILISEQIQVQIGNDVHLQYTYGLLRNWAVWHTIQTILHNIAEYMHYRLGAFYIATDGYILPIESSIPARQFLDRWGLEYHYSVGQATITRWGGYEILTAGEGRQYKKTKMYGIKSANGASNIFRNVEKLERDTLVWWSQLGV